MREATRGRLCACGARHASLDGWEWLPPFSNRELAEGLSEEDVINVIHPEFKDCPTSISWGLSDSCYPMCSTYPIGQIED